MEPSPQLPLDLQSIPSFGQSDFFVGDCNVTAVRRLESAPVGWLPFPAFILYGEKGAGKSHLASVWAERVKARTLSASDFAALRIEDLLSSDKNLVIDRIDCLIGEREQEEKLFHLYNASQQQGRFFLGLSRLSPERLTFEIPDLASRLRACPRAEISAPDDALLLKVMAKRFHDQGYLVQESVLSFAVTRMERSWDATDTLVGRIIAKATAEKKPVTIPLIRDLLV